MNKDIITVTSPLLPNLEEFSEFLKQIWDSKWITNNGSFHQQLEQALEKLPSHEQAIVSMFYYDNMSLADIAFVTGSITSTVGSQLSRIRKKL